jgi:hypothetical protein
MARWLDGYLTWLMAEHGDNPGLFPDCTCRHLDERAPAAPALRHPRARVPPAARVRVHVLKYSIQFNKLLLGFLYRQHTGVASSVYLVPLWVFLRPLSIPRVLPFVDPLAPLLNYLLKPRPPPPPHHESCRPPPTREVFG